MTTHDHSHTPTSPDEERTLVLVDSDMIELEFDTQVHTPEQTEAHSAPEQTEVHSEENAATAVDDDDTNTPDDTAKEKLKRERTVDYDKKVAAAQAMAEQHNADQAHHTYDKSCSRLDRITASMAVSIANDKYHVFTLQAVSAAYGVSRTVAREVVQNLHKCNIVTVARRTGIAVNPVDTWDVTNPIVITALSHSPYATRLAHDIDITIRQLMPSAILDVSYTAPSHIIDKLDDHAYEYEKNTDVDDRYDAYTSFMQLIIDNTTNVLIASIFTNTRDYHNLGVLERIAHNNFITPSDLGDLAVAMRDRKHDRINDIAVRIFSYH